MMKRLKELTRANKVLLIVLPLMVLVAGGVLLLSLGQRLGSNASCGCGASAEATGEYRETDEVPIFANQPVDYRSAELTPTAEALKEQEKAVLGATADERWVEIDLSEQKLRAREGDKVTYEFLISSGKWAPTPTGEFRIWIKLRYTKMSGGSQARHTYYYLPNVPYTQYFYKDYGLHGTYWHNNFGHPMSHGCVNLSIPDAERLFYWTSPIIPRGRGIVYPSKDNPGTKVVIHE